jgi:Tol biopolymer transport system component
MSRRPPRHRYPAGQVAAAALLAAGLCAAIGSAPPATAGDTGGCPSGIVRASHGRAGDTDGLALEPSISGDGRHVAFFSDATNLVADDTNGYGDIFVFDRASARVTRASLGGTRRQGNWHSSLQDLSDDGRYVAFGSSATNLVSGDRNGLPDTFVRDRQARTTVLASLTDDGSQGVEGGSSTPSLTGDGQAVGFYSVASNLVPGDTNEVADVFVRDLLRGRTERISVASDGTGADQQSGVYSGPALSRTGRFVAFESDATNLVPRDTNAAQDVFVRDRRRGTTTRVSVTSTGRQVRRESYWPAISAGGRFVAFASRSDRLVGDDGNDAWDIFVHDRRSTTTTRVSVSSQGGEANAFSYSPSISATGRYVAFWSYADNLVPGDSNGVADVFVHDRRRGTTRLVSQACDGSPADGESLLPAISDDGTVIAFESAATNLVPGDGNGVPDVYVAELGVG